MLGLPAALPAVNLPGTALRGSCCAIALRPLCAHPPTHPPACHLSLVVQINWTPWLSDVAVNPPMINDMATSKFGVDVAARCAGCRRTGPWLACCRWSVSSLLQLSLPPSRLQPPPSATAHTRRLPPPPTCHNAHTPTLPAVPCAPPSFLLRSLQAAGRCQPGRDAASDGVRGLCLCCRRRSIHTLCAGHPQRVGRVR